MWSASRKGNITSFDGERKWRAGPNEMIVINGSRKIRVCHNVRTAGCSDYVGCARIWWRNTVCARHDGYSLRAGRCASQFYLIINGAVSRGADRGIARITYVRSTWNQTGCPRASEQRDERRRCGCELNLSLAPNGAQMRQKRANVEFIKILYMAPTRNSPASDISSKIAKPTSKAPISRQSSPFYPTTHAYKNPIHPSFLAICLPALIARYLRP